MLFSNKTRKIGVHISPTYVAVSEKVRKSHGSSCFDEQRYQLENESCSATALIDNFDKIHYAAKYIAERIGNQYTDVCVSLAEPYLDSKILVVERNPKANKNFKQFLRWKLKNEYYIDADNMYLSYQIMGAERGLYYILVQICDIRLVQLINGAFSNQSIPVKLIDASYSFVHNYLTSIIKKERTYFLLHLDGYWMFSSLNNQLWPERIRSECLASTEFTEKEWAETLGNVYSNIARIFYLDIEKGHRDDLANPVIYSIGNINADYHQLWDKYFPVEQKSAKDLMSNDDYKDYFGDDGFLSIERLVALCQR